MNNPTPTQALELAGELERLDAVYRAAQSAVQPDGKGQSSWTVATTQINHALHGNLPTILTALRSYGRAREAALEEAAAACESLTGSDATPTLRQGARMCLHRIRNLKGNGQ